MSRLVLTLTGLACLVAPGAARAELVVRAVGEGAAANQASFAEWLQQLRARSHALDALIARIEQDRQAQVTLTLRRDTCGFLDSATQAGGKGRVEINLNNLERLARRQSGDLPPAWALSAADELAFALQEAFVMSLAQLPLDQGAPKEAGLAGLNRVREEMHNASVLATLERSQFGEDAGGSRDCQAPAIYREIRFAGGRYQYVSFDRWGHLHNAFIDLTALTAKAAPDNGVAGKARGPSAIGSDAPAGRAPAPPRRPKSAAAPHVLPAPMWDSAGGMPMPLIVDATARSSDKPPASDAGRAAGIVPLRITDTARSRRARGVESNGGGNE